MQNSFWYKSILSLASFLLISTSILKAEHNTTVDQYYKTVSTGVIDLSEYLDTTISQWLTSDDENNVEEVEIK